MTTKQFMIRATLASLVSVFIFSFSSCKQNPSENSATEETNKSEKIVKKQKPSMDLHAAVFMGNLNALKEHIVYGTDLNKKDAYGSSPLNIATTFGKTEIALLLIDSGVDINARNADGGTALHTAAFFCRTEIVKALIESGAEQNIKNQYQSTALESVMAPWENMKPIYEQMAKDLGALGLRIDLVRIEKTRPEIAELLK